VEWIQVVGTDRCGNAVITNIVVNGNGTFQITDWYATVTSTQITVWNGGGGDSFDYELIQGQWGVIWKLGLTEYYFEAFIQIGDSVTTTWLADSNKQIAVKSTLWTANYQTFIGVKANAHLRFGILLSGYKAGYYGVDIYVKSRIVEIGYIVTLNLIEEELGGDVKIYASRIVADSDYTTFRVLLYGDADVYTSIIDGRVPIWIMDGSDVDLSDLILRGRGTSIVPYGGSPTLNRISSYNSRACIMFYTNKLGDIKNFYQRAETYQVIYCQDIIVDHSIINGDFEAWTFRWQGGAGNTHKIYRKYEFDACCIDCNGDPINGVSVVGEYISPYGNAFSDTTGGDGKISTQTLEHGWFEYQYGDTEQLKTPLKVTYSKAGYETVVKYYPLDEKTSDRICLVRPKHTSSQVFKIIGRQELKKT